MATITLDIDNDIDVKEIIATISNLKGINKIELISKTKTSSQTKTAELLEKMERGEYVSDDEYLASIPGFLEKLDEECNDPNTEWIPIEEVIPGWRDRKKRKVDV